MRTRRLPKIFEFKESNRPRVTLGTGTRLNPNTNRLELAEPYTTDPDLTAKTWVAFPRNVKQWIGFDVDIANAKDDLGNEVTGANYRLGDGTTEYYWDGGSWAVAGATDWNTEAEVANNIGSFPVTERKIQVIINPFTTDAAYTPKIRAVKILHASTLEEQEDLIRSLLQLLKDEIRPIGRYVIAKAATSATIDLNDFPLETPYNLVDIDSVFNVTDDPNKLTDLLDSFDSGTQVITLNTSVDAGKHVQINFTYEPEVAITTSQEYTEVAKVPAIVLSDVNVEDSAQVGQDEHVRNKDQGTAVKIPGPVQADLEVIGRLLADKELDQHRMADELKRFFGKYPKLTSLGLDEEYRLWLLDEYNQQTIPNQEGIHTGRLRFRVVKALFFDRPAEDLYAVERFHLTGDADLVIS